METKSKRRKYTREERQSILEKTGCRCGHCGVPLETWSMSVDHVFPLHKGGEDEEFNLLPLCYDCNFKKANLVISLADYYKYILPEYMNDYLEYNIKAYSKYKENSIIPFDAHIFEMVPTKYQEMIGGMIRRGTKKKKVLDTISKLTMQITIEPAREYDSQDIMDLITRVRNKNYNNFDTSLYDNIYAVRNDILDGNCYVLRYNKNVCGAVMFKKVAEDEINLPQLRVIEMNTSLKKRYMLSMVCLSNNCYEIFPDLMDYVFHRMISNDTIPLYFNTLSKFYKIESDIIKIPYKVDKVDGMVEFLHLKAIRERIKEKMFGAYFNNESDIISEEEMDYFVEKLLSNELGNKDDDRLKEIFSRLEEQAGD